MHVTVRAFATVRELLGSGTLELDLPAPATLADVVAAVAARPGADNLKAWFETGHLRLAHNHEHANPDAPVSEGDIVALFPPVSGG